MPLKRGILRRSCGFCFRRKIRCDRVSRISKGYQNCTSCETRKNRCCLDAGEHHQDFHQLEYSGAELGSQIPLSDAVDHMLSPQTETPGADRLETLLFSTETSLDDDLFALSDESQLFLNETFQSAGNIIIPGHQSMDGLDGLDFHAIPHMSPSTPVVDMDQISKFPANRYVKALGNIITPEDLQASVHAYFAFASTALPVLFADAFWNDYNAGRCSLSLVFSVACYGIPFTIIENKWVIQLQLANAFRETYLVSRAAAMEDDKNPIRVDDLEALAIMIDFHYEENQRSTQHQLQLQKNLQKLFLTHDSLVLSVLRYAQLEAVTSQPQELSLSRLNDRRILLYWHVFGKDAFRCLDRKQLSYLPEVNLAELRRMSQDESRDYLDAILELATIARMITQTFCNPICKKNGLPPSAVENLYDQLAAWRQNCCLPQQQAPNLGEHCHDLSQESETNTKNPAKLHRAILCALEVNCIMQIESCVSTYHLSSCDLLEVDRFVPRIQWESLYAIRRILDEFTSNTTVPNQLIRMTNWVPHILRDICAGICVWIYQQIMDGRLPITESSCKYTSPASNVCEQMDYYTTIAQTLTNAVASATSHKDTTVVLERINELRVMASKAAELVGAS